MIKALTYSLLALLTLTGLARAAEPIAIRPMINPVFFDSPDISLNVHPIFMHQALSKRVKVDHPALGKTTLPVDGDFQLYALQFEVPLAENLSLIAVKDGYVDLNPDSTLSQDEGFADLAAGLKYVFLRNETSVASGRLVYEFPIGNDGVAQANGDGVVNPGVSFQTFLGAVQLAVTGGLTLPVDGGAESTMLYHSWHLSYPVCSRFIPLIELSHWRVLDAGDGEAHFDNHVDGAVPAVLRFEGGDLINLGAAHADDGKDQVTLALGARVPLCSAADLGVAYEMPLTDDEETLMDYRVTVDMVIKL